MRSLHIDGHRIPCRLCKRDAKVRAVTGTYLCGRCFRAYALGLLVGRVTREEESK